MAMRLADLKRLHALNKEIEYEKARLYSLCQRRDHVGIIGIGSFKKSEFSNEISVLQERVRTHLKECLSLYKQILDFINAIPDALLRLSISLRYINGLEWEQVALHIGGGNKPDAIRKSCERYLKCHLSKD